MYFLVDFVRETVDVLVRTAPFLLFGFFLAGVLKVLIPPSWLSGALGKRDTASALRATLVGMPLPLCSCSVLPTAVALRDSGASKGSTVSFLVSTPETGIDSISVTYALMDPIMTVARPAAAFATAMAAGVAVNLSESPDAAAPPGEISRRDAVSAPPQPIESVRPVGPSSAVLSSAPGEGRRRVREIFSYAYGELLDGIVPWFLVGLVLTGLIAAIVPAGALANPGLRGFPSMLLMLVIGIPLYVCATSSTPIAAALIMKGLSPGAALVFLLVGPATNAASISVLYKILGRRTVVIYLVTVAVVSLLAGIIVNGIYAMSGVDATAVAGRAGEILPSWLEVPGTLVLLFLILRSARRIRLLDRYRDGLTRLGRPLQLSLGGRPALRVYAGILLVLYLLTAVSIVGPGEIGWVVSFGKIIRTVPESGLVVHWPYPFARLETEQTERVRAIDRGYRQGEAAPYTLEYTGTSDEATQLVKEAEVATGDENLLAVRYGVQYAVSNPYTYHYEVLDPDQLVAAFAESAVRRVMAEQETDSILVNHRIELQSEIADRLMGELGAVGGGIEVLRVDLVDVHAPAEAHPAFRDVASAMEDKHRAIRQAESDRNQIVASARGKAYTTIVASEREKLRRVAEASGRAKGFTALERACRTSRQITQLRLHLDAASRLLPKARVILPLVGLPLDLWVSRTPGAAIWPEPQARGAASDPGRGAEEGQKAGAADAAARRSGESLWDKLERLEEGQP